MVLKKWDLELQETDSRCPATYFEDPLTGKSINAGLGVFVDDIARLHIVDGSSAHEVASTILKAEKCLTTHTSEGL